jgi:hypothetical protein
MDIENNIDEQTALLQESQRIKSSCCKGLDIFSTKTTNVKCWACWENNTSSNNPLIRVCHHCKDPELQYIHQECINTYISSLPLPRRPRSPRPQQQSINEFLDSDTNIEVLYDCTRCRDPYVVEERPIHPIWVIIQDPWLRIIFNLIVLACVLMFAAFIGILMGDWDSDIIFFELFGLTVTVLQFSLFLTLLGMVSGVTLTRSIWISSSGKKKLFVIGEPLMI